MSQLPIYLYTAIERENRQNEVWNEWKEVWKTEKRVHLINESSFLVTYSGQEKKVYKEY